MSSIPATSSALTSITSPAMPAEQGAEVENKNQTVSDSPSALKAGSKDFSITAPSSSSSSISSKTPIPPYRGKPRPEVEFQDWEVGSVPHTIKPKKPADDDTDTRMAKVNQVIKESYPHAGLPKGLKGSPEAQKELEAYLQFYNEIYEGLYPAAKSADTDEKAK